MNHLSNPRRSWLLAALAVIASCSFGCGDASSESILNPGLNASPSSTGEISQEADDAISVNQTLELQKKVGQEVVVEGIVSRASTSRSDHLFINFSNDAFYVFVPASAFRDFDFDNPAQALNGKKIRVSGKLERRDNRLQIVVTKQSQISFGDSAMKSDESDSTTSEPFEFKEVGRNHWLSPAGLNYKGLDPAGKTRIEHVERHVKDIPNRSGPHGVFDGDSAQAFAVIDEAWAKAKREDIRPARQGNRWAYTIPMERRVGYLGGQTGARRDNPPLFSVLIVVEADSSNLVTAYPK